MQFRHPKYHFIKDLPAQARVLDVGCGNNSCCITKNIRPDIFYAGIDVGDHNQAADPRASADRYVVVPSESFGDGITGMGRDFDAVISTHNLEHCLLPDRVLTAMIAAVKPGGQIFLVFPSAASVHFPSRRGTLNFYDDVTHRTPVDLDRVIAMLTAGGFSIETVVRRHRPPLLFLAGAFLEPWSYLTGQVVPYGVTWALYGFESIIKARKMRLS